MNYFIVKFNPSMNMAPHWMFIPGHKVLWGAKRLPKSLTTGDVILYWESGAGSRSVIAQGVVTEEPYQDGGLMRFMLKATTGYKPSGLTLETLRGDPLFQGAAFLKSGPADTVFTLTPEQGEYLTAKSAVELADTFRITCLEDGVDHVTTQYPEMGIAFQGTMVHGVLEGPLLAKIEDAEVTGVASKDVISDRDARTEARWKVSSMKHMVGGRDSSSYRILGASETDLPVLDVVPWGKYDMESGEVTVLLKGPEDTPIPDCIRDGMVSGSVVSTRALAELLVRALKEENDARFLGRTDAVRPSDP